MRSIEKNVASCSDYYMYTPSAAAIKMFFYSLFVGYFYYEPNYRLDRSRYDSYLIMVITKGSCTITYQGKVFTTYKDDVVLLNCYHSHSYGSCEAWEALWLHFDGTLADEYYQYLVDNFGNIINPTNLQTIILYLNLIYKAFKESKPVSEAVISKHITIILTELLLSKSKSTSTVSHALENTIRYINEHFSEPLSLRTLAAHASLSPYYFTRVFAKETGMTPHQYIVFSRINSAKYLLKTSTLSIKEIAFASGFSSESSFCTTFKKWEKKTPSCYRSSLK